MRSVIAIVLTILFGWTLLVPVWSPTTESTLPACCRKSGRHGCAMQNANGQQYRTSSWTKLGEKCPYQPSVVSSFHENNGVVPPGAFISAGLLTLSSISAQAEAGYRISYERSRQKRGPPTSSKS